MLSARYRIGVIANQPAGTEERLTNWGLMPLVSICLSSTEVGLEKPDPAIFRLALTRAECAPEEAVMIGDRLDNDIRPARLQGWKTIRILQGFARASSRALRDFSRRGIGSTRPTQPWQSCRSCCPSSCPRSPDRRLRRP